MNRFLALLLAFLILTSAVSAELVVNKYTNDFVASSPNNEQIKLCGCETKVDKIIVENIGTFYGDFHVDVQGDYPNSMRIVKQDFQLAPKHFQEVLIYIEDSCGLSGTYEYDVVVSNSYGRTQVISRSIRVDQCQTGALEVQPDNRTVGLCQPATFQVRVSNVGTFADTFVLGFGQYEPVAEARELYLLPGESYEQDVTFLFACNEYGTKNVPFTLYTSKNGPAATTTRDIHITNQYNYALNVESRIDVCARTQTQVPITIENIASVPDDVRITLDAPRFVSMPAGVHLEPNERQNLTLTVSAEEPGTHRIFITASDPHGVLREREIALQVNNCYDPAVDVRVTPEVVLTEPDTACCGQKTYYVNVRNDGDREQAFTLQVDGPSFFVLDETTVRLEPGQNINVPLRADLPCSDEQYSARVIVTPLGQQQVSVSGELHVNSLTQRTCHMVQIDDDELAIQETATIVPVIVKHTGVEGGEYSIDVNSTIFDIQEESITLMPGDQRAIHLVPKVNLSEAEKGRYIALPSFTFTEQEIRYNEAVGVELEGKGLLQRFKDWMSGLPWSSITLCVIAIFLLLLLIIAAAVVLALIYAGKPLNGLRPTTLFWLKSALLAGMVFLLIAIFFLHAPDASMTYERVAQTTDVTRIEMYQNTEMVLDVAQYFTDPDMDILSYTVTQPRDISATIEGSTLTLRPDHNFAGENTMVITASDSRGGIADSPVFVISVIPRRDISFLQWLQLWCHHFIVGGLLLLLLLLFLIVLTIPEYRTRPYSGNTLVLVERPIVRKSIRKSTRKTTSKSTSKAARKTKPGKTRRTAKSSGVRKTGTAARKTGKPRAASKALVPRRVTAARGKQVTARSAQIMPRETKSGGTVIRDFREGQTVNIAVGTPHAAPAVVPVPGYKQSEIIYVGSKEGNTVHTPYCINARRIPKNRRIAYSTKREAVNAGLVPCKMCRPFEGGM